MKKILYILVNSKPENLSSSLTAGKFFIKHLIKKYPNYEVEELDLYSDHIPRLEYQYFDGPNRIIKEEDAKNLPEKEQQEIRKIRELCDQFISADIYVIAAPMWSLSFPAPLKEYIDCIVQENLTISFPEKGKKPVGLLDNKPRAVVYIQSSGSEIPFVARPILNRGLDYIQDIMKFMGINQFERLLVDGTGTTEKERRAALAKAEEKVDKIIEKL